MKNKIVLIVSKDEELIQFISACIVKRNKNTTDGFNVAVLADVSELCVPKIESNIVIVDSELIDSLIECKESLNMEVPYLIMMKTETVEELNNFDFNRLDFLKIFDFLRKPFLENIFYNKLKALIKLDEYNKLLNTDKTKAVEQLWNLLNYTNLFVMVLDDNLNIRLANWPLLKFLNIEEEKSIGLNWLTYVSDGDKDHLNYSFQKIIKQEESYVEVTNDIKSEKETVTVRWFATYVNNITHLLFCIGVPISYSISTQANVDTVRAYYRDIIMQDREMIKNIKELTFKEK